MKNKLIIASIVLLAGSINTAFALPALQLGGDGTSAWEYDASVDEETWVVTDSSFTINAFANCDGYMAGCNADHGFYAWDEMGATDQYAYLVVAAAPRVGDLGDLFDISIVNDGGVTLVDSGYGRPPIEDSNSISGHGIYSTYFEIYEFQFDGLIGTITDQQPLSAGGSGGSGDGYTESFDITVNFLDELAGVNGLHFDLFTVAGAQYAPGSTTEVYRVAPYSHDAEYRVPAPGAAFLLGIGLIGLAAMRKKVS